MDKPKPEFDMIHIRMTGLTKNVEICQLHCFVPSERMSDLEEEMKKMAIMFLEGPQE